MKYFLIFLCLFISCTRSKSTNAVTDTLSNQDDSYLKTNTIEILPSIEVSSKVQKMDITSLLEIITGVWELWDFSEMENEEATRQMIASLHEEKLGTGSFWSTPTSLVINCIGEKKFLSIQGTYPKKLIKFNKTGDGQIDISLESSQGDERVLGVLRVTVINEEEMFLEEISSPFFSNGAKFYTSGWIEFGKKNIWHKFIYKKE